MAKNLMDEKKKKIYLHAPDGEFLKPYIGREIPDVEFVAEHSDAEYMVAIIAPGEDVPSEIKSCATVLECPNIVGTGMKGLPMTIAGKILNGTYCHVVGNETKISTIHASDVARAVKLSLGVPGRFVVMDGVNPTIHDFAEAIAYRIEQKRIYTLKPFLARLLLTGKLYETVTTEKLVDGSDFASRFDFKPVAVTEYLRTHVYDDESL